MKAVLAMLSVLLLIVACGPTQPAPPQAAPPVPEPALPAAPEPTSPASPAETPSGPESLEGNDAKNVEYDQNELVTNVACDFNAAKISFTLKNTVGMDLELYHGQIKEPRNTLKVLFNGLQFNSAKTESKLDCGDIIIKQGETRSCVGNVPIRSLQEDLTHIGTNRLIAKYAGGADVTYFECTP